MRQNSAECAFSSNESWVILSPIEQSIKKKIESVGVPLKNWDISINYGIKTGFNDAFIINGSKRNEILANCKTDEERKRTEAIIRPILRGRDIKRYSYTWNDLWLIYIPWHFPLQFDETIQGASEKAETEFKKQYPAVYSHLLQYKKELSARNKAETGIRYEWYAMQRWGANYWEDFDKPKIVWAELSRTGNSFAFDNAKMFVGNTGYILTVPNDNPEILKYLLGFLNSRIILYYLDLICTRLDDNGWRWLRQFVENIPIPEQSLNNSSKLIKTVGNIDEYNQQDFSNKINEIVAEIFRLTDAEISYIDKNLSKY